MFKPPNYQLIKVPDKLLLLEVFGAYSPTYIIKPVSILLAPISAYVLDNTTSSR
jgi:hypothetical protein